MNRFPTRRACLRGAVAATAGFSVGLPRAAAEDIVIGQSIHLTGPAAASMVRPIKGEELAVEEFNRKGGAGGRKVRLVVLDDGYDPKRTVQNANTLIDKERVTALFGFASTTAVSALLPILDEKKVPLVCVFSGLPSLRAQHHPYLFTTLASSRDEVAKMVQNLASGQRRRLALAVLNNPFGKEMAPIVDEVAKELGSAIVATQVIELNGSNAVPACQKMAAAKPDGLILMVFGPSLAPLVRAARNYLGVPIYAPTVANSRDSIEALGEDARGLAFTRILPNALRATTSLTRDYAAVMERAKIPLDHDHFFGYLNMRVLLEAIRRAGRNVSPQTVVASLEKMSNIDLGGYKLNFSPTNHHGSKYVDLTVIGPGGRYIM